MNVCQIHHVKPIYYMQSDQLLILLLYSCNDSSVLCKVNLIKTSSRVIVKSVIRKQPLDTLTRPLTTYLVTLCVALCRNCC